MTRSRTTPAMRARHAASQVDPSDLSAMAALWESDPVTFAAMRDAVLVAVSRLSAGTMGVDPQDVAAVAVVRVARAYSRHGDSDAAVAMAVRDGVRAGQALAMARVTSGDASLDVTEVRDAIELRLPRWTAPTDRIGSVDSLASRVGDALATLPVETVREFRAMRAAYDGHSSVDCDACRRTGAAPSLSTIRAHVAGLLSGDARSRAMRRADGAVLAAVSEVLAPLVTPGAYADGVVWPMVYGQAWQAVNGANSTRAAGNVDPVARVATVETRARVTVAGSREVLSAPVAIPAMRVGEVVARREAAWEAGEVARQAKVTARTAESSRPASAMVLPAAPGQPRAVRLIPAGLPVWVHGPDAGPAPEPVAPVTMGRALIGRTATPVSVSRVVAHGEPESFRLLPVAEGTPVTDIIRVTRPDGVVVHRAMTEAEAEAGARVVEVTADGTPVVTGEWPGEEGMTGGTAPIGARDRRAGEPDGQVRAFKPVVSPRKRAAGNTGPTVPVRLRANA